MIVCKNGDSVDLVPRFKREIGKSREVGFTQVNLVVSM